MADVGFTGGKTYRTAAAIARTADDALYQSERYGNLSYTMPVEDGAYEVTQKVAEIYWTGAGKRVFNVLTEDQTVLS